MMYVFFHVWAIFPIISAVVKKKYFLLQFHVLQLFQRFQVFYHLPLYQGHSEGVNCMLTNQKNLDSSEEISQ